MHGNQDFLPMLFIVVSGLIPMEVFRKHVEPKSQKFYVDLRENRTGEFSNTLVECVLQFL